MNGAELRGVRKRLDLRQVELAAVLGLDNETICRWERREGGGREVPASAAMAVEALARDQERVEEIWRMRRRGRRVVKRKVKEAGDVE